MKTQTVSFSSISNEKTLRQDFDFHQYSNKYAADYYRFEELFEIISPEKINVDNLYSQFQYCEIGNAEKTGDIYPVSLDFSERNLLDENYYKKIEKGDIISVEKDDILLAKVRPNLKKYVRITDDLKDIYFTSAFIRIKAKQIPEVMYYCFRNLFYIDLMAISRQGKGYPTLNENDLVTLRFNRLAIDRLKSKGQELTKSILEREEKIRVLKSSLSNTQEIIDEIIALSFFINRDGLNAIDRERDIQPLFSGFQESNTNLRFSYRWNKAVKIQKMLLSQVKCCKQLGKYILSTQNGWSPACDENQSSYQVLGIDSVKKDGIVSFNNVKYSDEAKENLESFIVNDNDFFVTRGNTTDLVALAAVAYVKEDEPITIFPDLLIRVEFTEDICKEYLAFIFNSFIGRLYFKYSTKGKNQTMVKVSPQELSDFYVPIPSFDEQQRIVDIIHTEIAKQDAIKAEIADLRAQIDKIIEGAI